MTTQEIANRLVELCRQGDFKTAQEELLAEDAMSIEQEPALPLRKKPKESRQLKKREKSGILW